MLITEETVGVRECKGTLHFLLSLSVNLDLL